jgi:iron complex outermembrane receptor protein
MRHDLSCVLAILAATSASAACAGEPPAEALADLSLEQLSNVEIISVSRHAERLSDAPASIYVISHEDIARSGATTLPEALRLAPNLEVARVSASSYAISARGFNNSLGNKLLVLIDGRTVYTPLFSGVFWDQQEVLLEDVERIEVISGPGATLWGANAVNGVINVITRRASDSQGLLAAVQTGAEGSTASLRYGGALGAQGAFRAYVRHNEIDSTHSEAGATLPDAWRSDQAGFRGDWDLGEHEFTVQADTYRGRSEDRPFGPIEVSGSNLLASWNWRRAGGGSLHAQAYFDRTERLDPILFHDRMDILDLEFQHSIPFERHELLWGGGIRHARDEVERGLLVRFDPAEKDLHWENLFVQDEIRLREALRLTVGLKLDRNVYTGTELLPSVR